MEFANMFGSIDAHVAGEAYRLVTQSPIRLKPADLEEQAKELAGSFQTEKNLLLNEPRGHRGMHGVIATGSSKADIGLLFFTHDRVSAFKYEGVLAALGALLETGTLGRRGDDNYAVETTDGVIEVGAQFDGDEVTGLTVQNEHASVTHSPDSVSVLIDGKRNYLIYPIPESIPGIGLDHLASINEWGAAKTAALEAAGVGFAGVILVERGGKAGEVRSVTFEKDGYILRSAGIDTTVALFALHQNRGGTGPIVNTSLLGSTLMAEAIGEKAGVATVRAEPFVTGIHQFVLDREDPLDQGFLLV